MVIQHNLTAMNSNRMLGITQGAQAKASEKLSSGYRINRAADDAAGLSISEKMRKQINGLDRAATNAQDGVSAVQTAEGALTEVHSMLQRMNELAVQSANGTNSQTDRDAIQAEIDQLIDEIDRVAETTKFNETYLLKGDENAGTKDIYTYKTVTTPASFEEKVAGTKFYAAGETTAGNNLSEDAILAKLAAGETLYTSVATTANQDNADKVTTSNGYTINTVATKGTDVDNGITNITAGGTVEAGTYTYYEAGYDVDGVNGNATLANPGWFKNAPTEAGATGVTGITVTGIASQDDTVEVTKTVTKGQGVTNIYAKGGTTALTDAEIIAADTAGDDLYKVAAETTQTAAVADTDYTYDAGGEEVAAVLYDENGDAIAAEDLAEMVANGDTIKDKDGNVVTDLTAYTNKTTVNEDLQLNLHVGADSADTNKIGLAIKSMSAGGIGVNGLKVDSEDAATDAIDVISAAIQKVSEQRSELGAVQNRLEHTIANLDNVVENTTAAESRIRDTDMAEEMVEYSKNNILAQAGQSMLAQANTATQGVLSLLG